MISRRNQAVSKKAQTSIFSAAFYLLSWGGATFSTVVQSAAPTIAAPLTRMSIPIDQSHQLEKQDVLKETLEISDAKLSNPSRNSPQMPAATSTEIVAPVAENADSENLGNSEPIEPVFDDSPLLQEWLDEIPDVQAEIRRDPSFRTRLRLGYLRLDDGDDGLQVGIEDVFIGQTGLTLNAQYQETFDGDRQSFGGELRYYVRPLGSYINIAPTVGGRSLEIEEADISGETVGLRLLLALSRTGAADIAVSQSWVNPGSDRQEIGMTSVSFGYALTSQLRLATDIQRQNSRFSHDTFFGINLEWMF